MNLKWLLWVMSARMKQECRNNESFKKQIESKEFVVQIQTLDQSVARYFQFSSGKICSHPTIHAAPTLTLTFREARVAYDLFKNSRHNSAQLFKSINDKHLIAEGDYAVMAWFIDLAQQISLKIISWRKLDKIAS